MIHPAAKWIAIYAAILIAAILLTGCAGQSVNDGYQDVRILPIKFVDKLPTACAHTWYACTIRTVMPSGVMIVSTFVKNGLSAPQLECAIADEKRHRAGFDHPPDWKAC